MIQQLGRRKEHRLRPNYCSIIKTTNCENHNDIYINLNFVSIYVFESNRIPKKKNITFYKISTNYIKFDLLLVANDFYKVFNELRVCYGHPIPDGKRWLINYIKLLECVPKHAHSKHLNLTLLRKSAPMDLPLSQCDAQYVTHRRFGNAIYACMSKQTNPKTRVTLLHHFNGRVGQCGGVAAVDVIFNTDVHAFVVV